MTRFPAAIRIRNAGPQLIDRLGNLARFFKREQNDLVFYSTLGDGHSTSEQLVWIWGMVEHEAKILRKLRADGNDIFVDIQSGGRELSLECNAFLLPHKLGIPMEMRFR